MKKIILLTLMVTGSLGSYAQIKFEKSYAEALEKAKAEKKMLFISMSMTGCGPCALMEREVYPLPEVGKVYNDKFVCWKVNTSVDKTGEAIAQKFGINTYPSYLWLDPNTEKMVHYTKSSRRPADFIALADVPFNAEKASGAFMEAYKNGNRDLEIVGKLYDYHVDEGDRDKLVEIERDLFNRFGVDFKNPEMAEFYFKHIFRRRSEMTQYLLKNQKKVIKVYGKERVFDKISKLI